ncbi:MAG: hypothetical protein AB2693_34960 [Candidatus Thiodiazotropha sp.]
MKRKDTESFDELVKTKTLRLSDDMELKEDSLLLKKNINQEMDATLTYDHIMNEYVIALNKVTEAKQSSIALSEEETSSLIQKLPLAVTLGKKYLDKNSVRPVDIPFELVKITGRNEYRVVLFVKENQYGKEKIVLDLRKCAKNESGGYIYTKCGVRLSLEAANSIAEVLKECKEKIEKLSESSVFLFKTAECVLVVKAIKELFSQESKNCHGCAISHGSQKQHAGPSGCAKPWEEVVDDYWAPAYAQVQPEALFSLAEKAVLNLEELHSTLFSSSQFPIQRVGEDEVKAMALAFPNLDKSQMIDACENAASL